MKTKLMRIIALILFLIDISAYSQGINNNWLFGDFQWFQHSTNSFITGSAMNAGESVATVSDCNGGLLFYTDGATVWNRNHQVMLNGSGLFGEYSSTQLIIVPQPGDNDIYYIITSRQEEDSVTSDPYNFSVVDLSLDGGLGGVTAMKNVPLLDQTGLANLGTNRISQEAVTVCMNAGDTAYFVLIPFDDNLYAYEINNTGIVNLPIVSALMSLASGNVRNIKVSPDKSRVAISDVLNGTAVYDFDAVNGMATTYIGNLNFRFSSSDFAYSLEFSPDSNLLYFVTHDWLGSFAARLRVWDLSNSVNRIIPNTTGSPLSIGLQIDDQNRIFASSMNGLLQINSPNSYSGSNLVFAVAFTTAQINVFFNLPQRIPASATNCCLPDLITAVPITATVEEERSEWIQATNIINAALTERVVYHAGHFVELRAGFETRNGSRFAGYVEGCTDNFTYKNGSRSFTGPTASAVFAKKLVISPNPSSNVIDLSIENDTFSKVMMFGIDGKMVLEKTIENTSSYTLDISKYTAGVYIVNVISKEGRQYSQKLIKN